MTEIDWNAISGQLFSEPGKTKRAQCGVCGSRMKARRKVLVSTCLAESLAGRKHLCDHFFCPHIAESWHERITDLKMEVYRTTLKSLPAHRKSLGLPPNPSAAEDVAALKKKAAKEILRLLKKHTAR